MFASPVAAPRKIYAVGQAGRSAVQVRLGSGWNELEEDSFRDTRAVTALSSVRRALVVLPGIAREKTPKSILGPKHPASIKPMFTFT
jgi:hypothetical protein